MKRLYHIFNQADIRRYQYAFLKVLHYGELDPTPMSASRYERLHIRGRSSIETPLRSEGQTPISSRTPMSLQLQTPISLQTPVSPAVPVSPGVSIIENEFEYI